MKPIAEIVKKFTRFSDFLDGLVNSDAPFLLSQKLTCSRDFGFKHA
jgi:hypothetical protein